MHGPLSRTELARRLDLSTASLTRLTRMLLDEGIVAELPGVNRTDSGRPLQPLDVDATIGTFVGVKLTGTTAHGVRTNLRADVLAHATVTLTDRSLEAVADRLAELVTMLCGQRRPDAVGVGLGGSVVGGARVRRAPFLGWHDLDARRALTGRLRCPTVVTNDIDALVEAEHWFGHGRGVRNFAVLTVGAAVGGGLVIHDQLVTSADAGLGLLGHFPIDPLGPPCAEGHRGCAHSLMASESIQTHASLSYGRHVGFDEVIALAREGDSIAESIVGNAARAFGTLIAAVANIALPELVLLTGEGVAVAEAGWDVLLDSVAAARNPAAAPVDIRLVPDEPDLWARGAAAVAIQHTVLGLTGAAPTA